jgi:hypothetical protein
MDRLDSRVMVAPLKAAPTVQDVVNAVERLSPE